MTRANLAELATAIKVLAVLAALVLLALTLVLNSTVPDWCGVAQRDADTTCASIR